MLQDTQIKIRQISDSLNDVEEKYMRLEKKKLTLDATTERIDINFKALEDTEKKARAAQEDAARFMTELESLKTGIASLGEAQKKALEAAEKAGVLDAELSHIEERIAQMQAARQWLAKIETRLDEKHRQIKSNIKAIGTVPAVRRDRKSGDSVSLEDKEQVRALRRQGWKDEEIAAAMKLSIGEVELILDLPLRRDMAP